jgi:DNA-directed RNA polymerase specialized sigma24 family protein
VHVGTGQLDFAEFYRESKDGCLFAVLVSVGDRDVAQDLVDEAFARAWASWRSVGRHPAPAAWVVRTALNASISRWRKRRREVSLPEPGKVVNLAARQAPGTLQRDLRRDGIPAMVTTAASAPHIPARPDSPRS